MVHSYTMLSINRKSQKPGPIDTSGQVRRRHRPAKAMSFVLDLPFSNCKKGTGGAHRKRPSDLFPLSDLLGESYLGAIAVWGNFDLRSEAELLSKIFHPLTIMLLHFHLLVLAQLGLFLCIQPNCGLFIN